MPSLDSAESGKIKGSCCKLRIQIGYKRSLKMPKGVRNRPTVTVNQLNAQINPVLLLPLADRWLVETRAEFEGAFQRPPDGSSYGGPVSKNLDYAQVDYLANPYFCPAVTKLK